MPVVGRDIKFHLRSFVDFCRLEIQSGGPDPHMKMAEWLAIKSSDPLWVAGVYTAPYVVSTASAITSRFTRAAVLKDPEPLRQFVADNWDHLPIRKERRVNGVGPAKLAEIITLYARWLDGGGVERLKGLGFHDAFKALDPPHYGRYFKTKLYEVLRRTMASAGIPPGLPEMEDIVPRGGSHPRKALIYFYPGHKYKSDSRDDLEEANSLASELRDRLGEAGVDVDWFVLEVLLCNYRQAVAGGQYPGRAHDSELGHCDVVARKFRKDVDRILRCRSELFRPEYLGEIGRKWSGRRKELGKVMMTYGYVWSDALYDYPATTDVKYPEPRRQPCT